MNTRHQLTLFIPEQQALHVETLRRVLDPVQANLIAAHVTLCREDEFTAEEIAELLNRAEDWTNGPLRMEFGAPERFNGHGILMPCIHGLEDFHRLRQWVLQNQNARAHHAHLTLAHPGNPRSAGNDDKALLSCPNKLTVLFPQVAAIKQTDGQPWQICRTVLLGGPLSLDSPLQ